MYILTLIDNNDTEAKQPHTNKFALNFFTRSAINFESKLSLSYS